MRATPCALRPSFPESCAAPAAPALDFLLQLRIAMEYWCDKTGRCGAASQPKSASARVPARSKIPPTPESHGQPARAKVRAACAAGETAAPATTLSLHSTRRSLAPSARARSLQDSARARDAETKRA